MLFKLQSVVPCDLAARLCFLKGHRFPSGWAHILQLLLPGNHDQIWCVCLKTESAHGPLVLIRCSPGDEYGGWDVVGSHHHYCSWNRCCRCSEHFLSANDAQLGRVMRSVEQHLRCFRWSSAAVVVLTVEAWWNCSDCRESQGRIDHRCSLKLQGSQKIQKMSKDHTMSYYIGWIWMNWMSLAAVLRISHQSCCEKVYPLSARVGHNPEGTSGICWEKYRFAVTNGSSA